MKRRSLLHGGPALLAVLALLPGILFSGCSRLEDVLGGGTKHDDKPTSLVTEDAGRADTAETKTVVTTREETEPPATQTDPIRTEPAPEPVLNKDDITFFGPGENFAFQVLNLPAGAVVKWSSADPAVAAAEPDGRVTAVGPGTTQIFADVNGLRLSSWVRCRFEPSTAATCSVPDGNYRIALDRNRIEFLDDAADTCIAQARIMDYVTLTGEQLTDFQLGSAHTLDLSEYGYGVWNITNVILNTCQEHILVADGGTEFHFIQNNQLQWSLYYPESDVFAYWYSEEETFVFNESTAYYDQMTAVCDSAPEPYRYRNLLEYWAYWTAFSDKLEPFRLTVKDGVVTEITWEYRP